MLNRTKLHQKMNFSDAFIQQQKANHDALLHDIWSKISQDKDFKEHVQEAETLFSLPSWQGLLSSYSRVQNVVNEYAILGIDGSQVYPDRHQLYVQHALINIGGLAIEYGQVEPVTLFSEPEVHSLYRWNEYNELVMVTTEWINLEREAREFEVAVEKALMLQKKGSSRLVVLFDGSLLFYHLIAVNEKDRHRYFKRYCDALQRLTEHEILFASYVSAPQNKDLMNLVKLGLCRFKRANCRPCHEAYDTFPCEIIDSLSDRHLAQVILPLQHRTVFFEPDGMSNFLYPDEIQPYFSYYRGLHEVGRIEMPAWIAKQDELVTSVVGVIADQISKGQGYPVVLAEAHEQAVVKQADKEYFYQLCAQQASQQNIAVIYSEKSLKKKQMPY